MPFPTRLQQLPAGTRPSLRPDPDATVMVVDDSEVILLLMRHLAAQLPGVQVLTFSDPLEALAFCNTRVPDLLIVDYLMPELDGIGFISRVRPRPAWDEVPILMITASHDNEVRYRALEHGANDFLTKPVDRHEFLARAGNMLALRRTRRQLALRQEWLESEVERATADVRARERETILRLARAAEYRDAETGEHVLRMAHYCRHIADNMGLARPEQDLVFEAAPMHDIGKVGTPDHILLKRGRLTQDEFEIMKRHSRIGYEILSASSSVILQTAAEIALTHHERYDGSGYPTGIKGHDIPLFGRIVAVADVFDALTTTRPYKREWSVSEATDYLNENSGRHFDPDCVDAFCQDWDRVLGILGGRHSVIA